MLFQLATSKDYESSSAAFDMLAELTSKEDWIIEKFVKDFNYAKLLQRYLCHSFTIQRRAAYWAYSNLAASNAGIQLAIEMLPTVLLNYKR
jgi:hypothetical protein